MHVSFSYVPVSIAPLKVSELRFFASQQCKLNLETVGNKGLKSGQRLNRETIMKIKMFAASAAVALSFGATSASADCGEVSITEMDWASSAVVTAVANFLMTQGYGCDVQVVPSSTVPALTSLAETGKPDLSN